MSIEEYIEEILWNAIRAVEEQALLMRHLGEHAHENGAPAAAEQFFDRASSAQKSSEEIRNIVLQSSQSSTIEAEALINGKF